MLLQRAPALWRALRLCRHLTLALAGRSNNEGMAKETGVSWLKVVADPRAARCQAAAAALRSSAPPRHAAAACEPPCASDSSWT